MQEDKNQVKTTRWRLRRSIIKDRVNPRDFMRLNTIYCCEQCTYYEPAQRRCNLGFSPRHHTRDQQLKTYNMTGKMAFCRFLEVD